MSKISLTDNMMTIIVKMSDGNPGAIGAIMDILDKHDSIDPQSAMGGIGALLILDTWEIYGSDIYVLWSDKCNKDTRKMLMIMRSCQMGNFSHQKLKDMAADQSRVIDLTEEEWQENDDWVCENLTDFMKPEKVA